MVISEDIKRSLETYNKLFKLCEDAVEYIDDDLDKIKFIENVYAYFFIRHPGVFFSYKFEKALIDISQKISIPLIKDYEKNSFLHVVSAPYLTGGHTRVVKRWIKFAPKNSKHSVAVIIENFEIARNLFGELVTSKNGKLYLLEQGNHIEKSIVLRNIASEYEYIILHHHMHDAIPILAFGTENFKRPVIVYDHAQHCLWLGSLIADHILALTYQIFEFIKRRRGINYVSYAGIPTEKEITNDLVSNEKKVFIKRKIGFSDDSKIILSIGTEYKYSGIDFINYVDNVLKKTPNNVIFVIIGPNLKDKWEYLKNKYPNRIFVLGPIDNRYIYDYYNIADVYIDSYPVPGGTAFIDAVIRKINSIAMKGNYFDLDVKKYFEVPFEEWEERTIFLLDQDKFLFEEAILELKKYETTKWVENVHENIKNGPQLHKVKIADISTKNNNNIEFEDYDYFWHQQNIILMEKGSIDNNFYFLLSYAKKYKNIDFIFEFYLKNIKKIDINNIYTKYYDIEFKLESTRQELESTRQELESTRQELDSTRQELNRIINSSKYKIAVKLDKIARKTRLIYPLKWLISIVSKFKSNISYRV